MSYVFCPETLMVPEDVVPAGEVVPWTIAGGTVRNQRCAARCEVVNEGPLMEFRCWRGHVFQATPGDIVRVPPAPMLPAPCALSPEAPQLWGFPIEVDLTLEPGEMRIDP